MFELLILVIVAALIFDYINGFHDTANAIATTVSTGAMSVNAAVVMSGIFNFLGAIAGTAVAGFIAKGLADPATVTQTVVLSALVGASVWNLITWWYGIPSSSSHALVGGLAGAVTAHAGHDHLHWIALGKKVLIPLVTSPLLGFIGALLFMIGLAWVVRRMRPSVVNRGCRHMQLISACTLSFAHGSNDAQKAMGVITMALLAGMAAGVTMPHWMAPSAQAAAPEWVGWLHDVLPAWLHWLLPGPTNVPTWVVFACATAMSLGTMAGGRRIIRTMGAKIIRMDPPQGFAAQTAGTATILLASWMGNPVSTTHCISASILGAGSSRGLSKVRWGVAVNIVIAWVLTIPISAGIAWLCLEVFETCGLTG